MTNELGLALEIIVIISIFSLIFSPILCWLLPNRAQILG
jgi:hypothetical protein